MSFSELFLLAVNNADRLSGWGLAIFLLTYFMRKDTRRNAEILGLMDKYHALATDLAVTLSKLVERLDDDHDRKQA